MINATNQQSAEHTIAVPLAASANARSRLISTAIPACGLMLVLAMNLPYIHVPMYWDGLWITGAAQRLLENGLRPQIIQAWDVEAHPILLPEIVGLGWFVFGRALWVPHLIIACFAYLTVYSTYRVGELLYGRRVGIIAALLLVCYPLFRAQSTVLVLDLPAAALAITAIGFLIQRKTLPYLLSAAAMVLMKETAVLLIGTVLIYVIIRDRRMPWPALCATLIIHALPTLALASWLAYHVAMTGRLTESPLEPGALLAAYLPPALFRSDGAAAQFARLAWEYLAKHFLIGILTLLIFAYSFALQPWLALTRRRSWLAAARAWRAQPFWWVWGPAENVALLALPMLVHLAFMASNYGLHRYLLPEYPLFFIMAARALEGIFQRRARIAAATTAILAIFVIGWSQPWFGYSLSSPSNLGYLDLVETHQAAAAFIERSYPNATVLTGWPQYNELGLPAAGYVTRPLKVLAYAEKPPHAGRIADLGGRSFSDPLAIDLDDFDLLYYSEHIYDAVPSSKILPDIIARYNLPLIAEFRKNNERVAIYGNPKRLVQAQGRVR
jgi:4-amino-4-deoxy-L-arabinose transferase-like glycosyltransferase